MSRFYITNYQILAVLKKNPVPCFVQAKLNDALMGIFRVHNLSSPPYLSDEPHLNIHKVSEEDEFVVMGSDGLFDFFSNEEVVELVHRFISENPSADPAKYMLDQLLIRAAQNAGN